MTDLDEALGTALPVLSQHAAAVDAEASFPRASIDALAAQGLLGLTMPPDAGGLGRSPGDFVNVVRQIAGACGSTAMVYLMHSCATAVLGAAAPAGADGLLPRMASGEVLGTLAFSEKGSRSHFWAPTSRLIEEGGRARLKADKSWVTSASEADVWVASTLAADAETLTGSELYLVRPSQGGVSISGRFDGLGLRGNDSAPATIDATVTEADRLGAPHQGFDQMMSVVLPWFCLGNAAVSLGLARAALDAAIGHVTAAGFGHLGTTVADLPTVRAYVSKAWAQLAAADAYLDATAARVASPDEATVLHVLATKAHCNEVALSVTETALRVAGGAAFSRHVGIDRPYRDARAGFVMAPTSDALWDFAGRALCGMELF